MLNVVNLHITERCMFSCKNCFAIFHKNKELELSEWKLVVDNINHYFKTAGIKNGRINLAGGELLMVSFVVELITYIKSVGLDVSIITNGVMLNKQLIDDVAEHISMIGISVDSISKDTNIKIGRCDCDNNVLNVDQLIEIAKYIKSKGIKLKINSVITKLNLDENLNEFYNEINPDRIKILQMRVMGEMNKNSENLAISESEFQTYCEKINAKNLVIETSEDMEDSYYIVNPKGELQRNSNNKLTTVGNLLEENFNDMIKDCKINADKVEKRYKGE